MGTVTAQYVDGRWLLSVDELHGMGGSVRYLDEVGPLVRESLDQQLGDSAATSSVELAAVLDEPVAIALRELRAAAQARPAGSADLAAAVAAFTKIATVAGMSARDVHYLASLL